MERISTKKETQPPWFSVQSVERIFILFQYQWSTGNCIDFYLWHEISEKAHVKKEFSRENLKTCHESQIMTC